MGAYNELINGRSVNLMATNQTKAKKMTKSTSTSKSSTPKKASTAKKTTKKQPEMQSFKLAKETQPFMRAKITDQTVYWLIIGVMSITFVLWIVKFQTDIDALYDQIEYIQQQDELMEPIVSVDTTDTEATE